MRSMQQQLGNWGTISAFLVDTGKPRKTLLTYLLAYLLTYLLTPWNTVVLQKLTGSQLVKKFPAFYGTRRFITAFASVPILSHLDPVHTPTYHFLKIHFNVILPYTSWSSEQLFLSDVPTKTLYTSPLPYSCYMPRPFLYSIPKCPDLKLIKFPRI